MQTIDVPAKRSPRAVEALNAGLVALQGVLRLPGLESALDEGNVPDALYEGLEAWWESYSTYLSVVSESVSARCTTGCAACCHQNPRGLSGLEVLLVLRALRQREDWAEVKSALRLEAEAWHEQLSTSNTQDEVMAKTRRAAVRCPILDDSKRCRVYASRPVACRMFYAVTDPDWCDATHPNHADAVNPHFEPAQVLRQILLAISHRLGLETLPKDLWSAVSILDERLPSGTL